MINARKKITLLTGALLIGQAITIQNAHAMDVFSDISGNNNTEDNAAEIYNFYIANPVVAFYRNTLLAKYNELSSNLTDLHNKVSDKVNASLDALNDRAEIMYNYDYAALYDNTLTQGNALYNQASDKVVTIKNDMKNKAQAVCNYDYATAYNNAKAQGHVLYNQASDKVVTIKNEVKNKARALHNNATTQGRALYNQASDKAAVIKNRINDKATAIYNYDYATRYNNAKAQGLVLCNQASDKATTLRNDASTWYTDNAPRLRENFQQATNKEFWTRGFSAAKNSAIEYKNNAVQCIENIKNLPITLERAVDNKLAEKFNINPNGPVDADVIVDAVAKKAIISLTKYAALVTASLFTAYKTGVYCVDKYQEYQKACALDESIKQHLTDEKKAEITQLTGKELSDTDVQEIINTIKTHATAAEDNHVTQEMINLAVKEYVAKHISA